MKSEIRKLLTALTAAFMAASLCACSSGSASEDTESADDTENTEDVEETVEEEPADPLADYKFYDTETGLTMYMDPTMIEQDVESSNMAFVYVSTKYKVGGLKQENELFESNGIDMETYTLEDYGDLIVQALEISGAFGEDSYGNLYISHINTVDDTDYFNYSTIRRGTDAFWLVHFTCLADDQEEMLPVFELLGNTIEVE